MRKQYLIAALAVVALGSCCRQRVEQVPLDTAIQTYLMSRVKDGDTFVLATPVKVELDTIRIIGINTPEAGELLYEEATKALEQLIAGKDLYFEIDPNAATIVSYNRAVLWPFFYNEKGEKVNVAAEMVRLGYARLSLLRRNKYTPLLYQHDLEEALQEAQLEKRGLWQER